VTDGLLYVLSDPGPVPEPEFHDWYDTEHLPARLTVPGMVSAYRFAALDEQMPPWLATYDLSLSALESPEYRAIVANASDREKSIMSSLAVLDRRVYSLISDTGPTDEPPATLLAVAMSVPPDAEADVDAWYTDEHIPMLMAVPGWRRIRRFRLVAGTGPDLLSLHEIDGVSPFEQEGYRTAVSTPWRNRIVANATTRERRVFGLLDLPCVIDNRPESARLPPGRDQNRQGRLHQP
jgi:hypothetical protein